MNSVKTECEGLYGLGAGWTLESIPDQGGKFAVVTGSNSGIGFEAAKVLASKGARVVLAVRSEKKGQVAMDAILREVPQAAVETMPLDLADLRSVKQFAEDLCRKVQALDLLINNAGVMATPYLTTADGFELQFGTNHLGHFALTGRLFPLLRQTPGARVVTVSSAAHTGGRIDFDNLDGKKGYTRWKAYSQSKLANLIFAYELNRRLIQANLDTISVACHPGFAATNLTVAGFGLNRPWLGKGLGSLANMAAQSAAMGALPTLYAATEPSVKGGEYIGPIGRTGRNAMRGFPGPAMSSLRSHDPEVAQKLWEVSEELTGVHFDGL